MLVFYISGQFIKSSELLISSFALKHVNLCDYNCQVAMLNFNDMLMILFPQIIMTADNDYAEQIIFEEKN